MAENSYSIDKDGNVILSNNNGVAPLTLQPSGSCNETGAGVDVFINSNIGWKALTLAS